MAYLKASHDLYHGKALELRDAVQGWLAYIPETFPHYTRHTVQHSDEIVLQISKLLFKDDDPKKPVIQLSAVEAYILIAAAYLHDAGMVASDREKGNILTSDAWKNWTSNEGGGAKRWHEIEQMRQGHEPPDGTVRNFLADIQARFLIAEFIRRVHHVRAADVITQHQAALGRFAFDDPMLQRTISDVCVAHGLRPHELEDRERYPDQRDLRGQKVNVRFMAILLRLGDLLDMTCDRACPLLLNAACPLPADSLAHWTQYQRITHRLTAPDRIEITAECQTQEEHRILRDWCQWLVDEVRNAFALTARATRHHDWTPPIIGLDDVPSTIMIRPASGTSYFFSRWTFELDHDAVFQRLINDVYDHPAAFIRELIQNALDASRCQMYADLIKDGVEPPEYPTQVDENRRRRYPVHLSLRMIETGNPLSGELEKRQILTVDDSGIGMDREIIQRYFLQVGRSYYTTDEFRRSFRFVPTSRFGIGFLSVFAVSDKVTVETNKPSSSRQDGPIRLTLTGPRNYLLTERGERHGNGTRIDVLLREAMNPGDLTKRVSHWCRRVEFPIIVDDLGVITPVEAERPEQFTYEMSDVTEEGAKLAVRAFPVDRPGFEGELYVFARIDARGEAWDAWYWARYTYPDKHPQATKPEFPDDLTCLHGITVGVGYSFTSIAMRARLDCRSDSQHVTLSRSLYRNPLSIQMREPEILSRWEEILKEHLATSPRANSEDAWRYKQRLVDRYPLKSFWASVPESIRIHIAGQPRLVSLRDVETVPLLTTTLSPPNLDPYGLDLVLNKGKRTKAEVILPAWDNDTPTITYKDLEHLSDEHRKAIFTNRLAVLVRWLTSGHLAIDWRLGGEELALFAGDAIRLIDIAALPDPITIGFSAHKTTDPVPNHSILNSKNSFVQWLVRVKSACEQNQHGLSKEHSDRLISLLQTPLRHRGHELSKLTKYLQGWYELPSLPPELRPPDMELTRDMFLLSKPK